MPADDLSPTAQIVAPVRFIGLEDADLIVRSYLALEERQLDVLAVVPYAPSNWDVKLVRNGDTILNSVRSAARWCDSVTAASRKPHALPRRFDMQTGLAIIARAPDQPLASGDAAG